MFRLFKKTECEKIQEILSEYIDKRLAVAEEERVEAHLRECQTCRAELESLQATVNLLHRVPLVPVPRSFTLAKAEPVQRPVVFNVLRAATAVAALALAVLFLGDLFNLYEGTTPVAREALFASPPVMAEVSEKESLPAEEVRGAPAEEKEAEDEAALKYAEGAAQTPLAAVPQPASAETPEVVEEEMPSTDEAAVEELGLRWWGGRKVLGPLREIHVALLGVILVLGGATAFIGWRNRRKPGSRQGKEA